MATRDVEGWMKSARFILGCYNVEDLIKIPGTRWIIGGGVTTYAAAMARLQRGRRALHVAL